MLAKWRATLMIVYHGSYLKIVNIDLTLCAANKDFGKGFYVTKYHPHAEIWAKAKGKKHKTEGFVTEFLYYDSQFAEFLCKIKKFSQYDEEWLDFVIYNRDPMSKMHDYDIVEGPIANDKVQTRIHDFLKGELTKDDFLSELQYHEDTHQICFCTMKSLISLKSNKESADSAFIHLSEQIIEELMTENNIDEREATDIFYHSETFRNHLSDGVKGME